MEFQAAIIAALETHTQKELTEQASKIALPWTPLNDGLPTMLGRSTSCIALGAKGFVRPWAPESVWYVRTDLMGKRVAGPFLRSECARADEELEKQEYILIGGSDG